MAAWTKEASLTDARSNQACGVLRLGHSHESKVVIVAGGTRDDSYLTGSVEMLSVEDGTFGSNWQTGPTMPVATRDSASVVSTDQSSFFIIGGITNQGDASVSAKLFKMQCPTSSFDQCYWTNIGHEMRASTAKGMALAFPPDPLDTMRLPNSRPCIDGNYCCPTYTIICCGK